MPESRTTVAVGVDGSPASYAGLDWAIEYSQRRRRPLHIAHAYPAVASGPGVWTELAAEAAGHGARHAAQQVLDAAQEYARARTTMPVTTALHFAGAAAALREESRHAGLVVVGTRGRGGFRGLRLGSVAVSLSSHAQCPVVAVHGSDRTLVAADAPVVVGVDGSEGSKDAVAFAIEEAASAQAPLRAVLAVQHAWLDTPDAAAAEEIMASLLEEGERLGAEAVAGWTEKYPDVTVTRSVVRGHPGQALTAAGHDARLVVVGSRGRGGFAGLLLGSTSQTLLHHCDAPVAVVRPHH